ncbi:phosphotransferase [Kitasatospora sp. RG8]|uniref:phosphotransferase enzyme family protein n=1 Tax=Kitasatospora sp. RG8 TaxID=2820815 RepID=UPI001AE0227F|nr:phosphotransferase [Kitasatospora sp. RG8]MBP0451135.1 phosphotransferase [Kitasatospora sp. RG8]
MERSDTAAVVAALAAGYGLGVRDVTQLHAGHGTRNYRADGPDGRLFVKQYPAEADLAAEAAAIDLAEQAAEAGVPVPRLLRTTAGRTVSTDGPLALSVWEYVEPGSSEPRLTPGQAEAAGTALARIHRRFAGHPAPTGLPRQTRDWLAFDEGAARARIDGLLARIDALPAPGAFDLRSAEILRRRRELIRAVPRLLTGLPPLTSQVLHGDYSALNLMFDGDRLVAVVDFRPPDPFLAAYEIGRIAFPPEQVAESSSWPENACRLVSAYAAEHPGARAQDLVLSARIWLAHLLRSLYGVKEHYLDPRPLQDDLDAFWLHRDRTAQLLLGRLDEIEDALRVCVAGLARPWTTGLPPLTSEQQ